MRIVIEMSEEYYNIIKAIPDRQCDADMLIIKRGTPLNDVFDKIRAEIEELKPNNPNFKGYFEQNVALNKALGIIDKYRGKVDCRECKAEYECYYCKKYAESEE